MLVRERANWNIGRLIWSVARRLPPPCGWCGASGLLEEDAFLPKPAWATLMEFTGGS